MFLVIVVIQNTSSYKCAYKTDNVPLDLQNYHYSIQMDVFGILPNFPLGHQSCNHCPMVTMGGILSKLLTSRELSYQLKFTQSNQWFIITTSNANYSVGSVMD
jgi:hypothetical protein